AHDWYWFNISDNWIVANLTKCSYKICNFRLALNRLPMKRGEYASYIPNIRTLNLSIFLQKYISSNIFFWECKFLFLHQQKKLLHTGISQINEHTLFLQIHQSSYHFVFKIHFSFLLYVNQV